MSNLPHPRDFGAVRFFARVTAFVAECPHCGTVATFRPYAANSDAAFNVRTARWQCRTCERQYVIGLLAWPVPRGSGADALPDDQIPGPRQLAQLRAQGDGHWMPEELRAIGTMDQSNYTGEAERPPEDDPIDLELAIRPPADQFPKDWRGTAGEKPDYRPPTKERKRR